MKVFGFLLMILMCSCVDWQERPLSDSKLSPYIEKFKEHENQLNIIIEYLDSKKDNHSSSQEDESLPDTIQSIMKTVGISYMSKFTNDIGQDRCEGNTSYTLQIGKAYTKPYVYYVKDYCGNDIQYRTNIKVIKLNKDWVLVNTSYDWFRD